MATFSNKQVVDTIIANNGYYEGDPRVVRVVEYETNFGETCWGVVWETEPPATWLRYEIPTQYIRNPRVIWTPQNGSDAA